MQVHRIATADNAVSCTPIHSTAKSIPPTGAVNTPATPAADPHHIIIRTKPSDNPIRREILLPSDAPTLAIGPPTPAEPPNPSVRALAIMVPYVSLGDMAVSPCLSIFFIFSPEYSKSLCIT